MVAPKGELYTIIAFDPDGKPVALRMNADGEIMTVISGGSGSGSPAVAKGKLIIPVVFDPDGKPVGMGTDEYGQLKVGVAGAAGMVYVDRGDFAAVDWTHLTLTIDNAWHDLDLSSIVTDSSAVLVAFYWYVRDAVPGHAFLLRQNGLVLDANISVVTSQIANVYNYSDTWCACDGDQVIEYRIHTGTDKVGIGVKGWWK